MKESKEYFSLIGSSFVAVLGLYFITSLMALGFVNHVLQVDVVNINLSMALSISVFFLVITLLVLWRLNKNKQKIMENNINKYDHFIKKYFGLRIFMG